MRTHWMMVLGFLGSTGLGGAVQAADRVELSTRVSGVVEEVLVNNGQNVKKGTVLLRLNKVIYQAQLDEAHADTERLGAEEAEARRDLDRAQELYSRTVSSTTELDATKLRYTRAKSALSVANARLIIAKKNLLDTELKAPFNGVVAILPAAPGVVVAADCQPKVLVVMQR
ncbi:MAG: efflux RND transporter periplasmic adaptor subunit [Thiobacillaceae bacterium]